MIIAEERAREYEQVKHRGGAGGGLFEEIQDDCHRTCLNNY